MSRTIRLTMSQALIEFLKNQYVAFDDREEPFVEGVFTIFGHGNVLGLGQALEERGGRLVVHQAKNEQGMAHAAAAFGKQSLRKRIYACTSSVGPGAANMLTAAATASANRLPLLLLPGDVYADRQPDPVLQQLEQFNDLTVSTNDAFKAVSKFWDRITRPEQLMSSMINAMRVLTSPAETGAVTICLPQDVQGEAYDYPVSFFDKRVHRIERTPATPYMIKEAIALIKSKKKPLLICGGGVKYSEAGAELLEFAKAFNIPFAETQAGKSAIVWDNPYNLGGIGTTGDLSANIIAKETDLVIGVGTRYTDFTTSSKWLFQNPNVDYLNINIAAFDCYKLDAVRVCADAKVALQAIASELAEISYRSAYTNEYLNAKKAWIKELDRLDNIKYKDNFIPEISGHLDDKIDEYIAINGSTLTQTRVLSIINNLLATDAIVVGASGSLPGDMQRVWRPKSPNTYHMEYGYSCMGYEIAGALGAKLAEPTKEVYAFVGDGSYMMLNSELLTSIQENRKINVLVFDNISFGCINNLQMGHGMGSFFTETRKRTASGLNGELVKVDYAMNAKAYGCITYTVKNEQQLIQAIEDSKKQTVSTLIDIKVLPKTMTDGYESFWRVGNAEIAEKESITIATKAMKKELNKSRRY